MAFAPPVKAKVSSHMAKSTWTPLSNPSSNNQVFEERREIMKKWFAKWQDSQKRVVVGDILQSLSQRHLIELHENLNCKFPQERFDFTKILPRVLTLYLFSFLDPRTLCRCAQVSWYWNYLSELDCVWRPKCLKFGWYPTYQPTPFEEKIWKRFYVKTVHELNYAKPKVKQSPALTAGREYDDDIQGRLDTDRSLISRGSTRSHMSTTSTLGMKRGPVVPSSRRPLPSAKWEPPPWRGSDPKPLDTMRYNVLDNSSKYAKNSPGKSKSTTASAHHKKFSSTLNSARSLNIDRPKSARTPRTPKKINKTPTKSEDTILERPSSRTKQHESLQVSRSIESLDQTGKMKNGKPDDPFEVNSITRQSIDAGKRPQPVAKVSSNNNSFGKTMKTEMLIKELDAAKIEETETKEQVKVDESTSDLQGKGWQPAEGNSDDEDF